MDSVIRATALTKRYGSHRGVEELSFEVAAGEIFGLLGPNGAGKTTTIRLLLDLIRPTSGRLEVFGLAPRESARTRRRIGYLPGDLRLYDRLTGRELLGYFARLRALPGLGEAHELADRLELELDRPVKALSKGNRQKLGLVQALMHDPELLVLDEPTSGLDPLVQQTVYEILDDRRGRGRTVLLSSHVLPEVQRVADRVALLREGRLALVEGVESLRARTFTRVEASFAEIPASGEFDGVAGVRELDRHGETILFALEAEPDALVKALARHHVTGLDIHEADLEDVFLSLYREDRHAA